MTFTEKAAGELKLRLREALDASARRPARCSRARAAGRGAGSLEEAHVSTIHGFCAELLRERPVEARVDPLFAVLTETAGASGSSTRRSAVAPGAAAESARRRAARAAAIDAGWVLGARPRQDTPIDRLRRAAWELTQWRDFAARGRGVRSIATATIDRLVAELHEFAALTERPSYANDTLYLDTRRGASPEPGDSAAAGGGCFAPPQPRPTTTVWEARLVDLSRDRNFSKVRHGRGPGYRQGVTRASRVSALRSAPRHARSASASTPTPTSPPRSSRSSAARSIGYEELKARAGALDFLDLLLKARDLVRGNAGVRRGFQARFTHIFVDEFQDTDPLQAEILLLLASDDPEQTDWRRSTPVPGRLFIVGDPKQSIYRFRRADVGIYREVCERLVSGRRDAREADDQLPERAADPGVRERRVRAGHDRRPGHAAGRLRAAVAVPRRTSRGSPPSSRCRCRSRTASATCRR